MRCIICIPDTTLYIHIKQQAPHAFTCKHACIQQTAHFHCQRAQGFSASECEVSVRACASAFETSVQAHLKVQTCTSSLAVKLYSRGVALLTVKVCCHSEASSTLAASTLAGKLRVRSQQSLESTPSTRRFPLSKLRPSRVGRSFDTRTVVLISAETGRRS